MTSVDRARFIADLSSHSIPVRDITASLPSLSNQGAVEIDAIAGDDHVFDKPEELGALYDKLVALENVDRASGRSGDLDRARAVYARYTATASTMTPSPQAPIGEPSARPRTTGIVAPQAELSNAGYVRAYGRMHAAQLREAADRDALGEPARARRRILDETDRVATRVAGMTDPAAINAEINTFENYIASERTALAAAAANRSPPNLLRVLPPYLRDSLEQRGLKIPGMPGVLQPSYSPPGLGWGIKF